MDQDYIYLIRIKVQNFTNSELINIICNKMAKDESLTHSPFHFKINIDSIH